MLTRGILSGMNMLTLVGLILTGFGLTLHLSIRRGSAVARDFVLRGGTKFPIHITIAFLQKGNR
jgi:hypothetical protein